LIEFGRWLSDGDGRAPSHAAILVVGKCTCPRASLAEAPRAGRLRGSGDGRRAPAGLILAIRRYACGRPLSTGLRALSGKVNFRDRHHERRQKHKYAMKDLTVICMM
jgi:hypothetical protein